MILRAGPGHQVDITFRAVLLASAPTAPVDLVLVPGAAATSGAGAVPHVIDLVGPGALDALAARSGATQDVPAALTLVRAGPAAPDASAARDFARQVVGITSSAGRPPGSVVLDLGLDEAPDLDDALLRLEATAAVAGRGHPVAVAVDGRAGSPEAVVVTAMVLGARVLRLVAGGAGAREVRRAADVSEALLVERAGGGRAVVVVP